MSLGWQSFRGALIASLSAVGSVAAEPQTGTMRLEDGTELGWTLNEFTPAPALGVAVPSYVEWATGKLDKPLHIDLSTNYAAFIERWEFGLYRESDSNRKHPIRIWRGPSVELDAGVIWDGTVDNGPPLRPGETVIAVLRVRDVAGNVDEAQPQMMLLSRYLMPVQQRKLKKETRSRLSALIAGAPPIIQTIPVTGTQFDVRIEQSVTSDPMRIAGIAMDNEGQGRWSLSQLLPPGSFSMRVQQERPILGGARLVSGGRIMLSVPRSKDRYATVKRTGSIARKELNLDAEGMTRDGAISGQEAVRLILWKQGDPTGRYTIAVADPNAPAGLYRDDRGRSVLRVRPALRETPWGTQVKPRKQSKTVTMRAQFPVKDLTRLTLPHTDIAEGKFFLSIRSSGSNAKYLRAGAHYQLEPMQGLIVFSDAGRAVIQNEIANGATAIEATYPVHSSYAGLNRRRPDQGDVFVMRDDGTAMARLYGGAIPARATTVAGQGLEPEKDWVGRNFGWLLGN